jgi:hypothetical protein
MIADFGIALAVGVAGGSRLTETGLGVGTPCYMSPEQATGESQLGPQTDIFSLCCVLYEVLVGEPPYTGSTPQAVLGKVLQAKPVSATSARDSVPRHVDGVIRKGLEKVPADRFKTAGEVARRLEDPSFRYEPSADRSAGTAPVRKGRHPWSSYLALAAVIVVFSVASVAVFWAITRNAPVDVVNQVPVVVLMDTFAPRGIYDQETRDNSGTNADLLSEVLRDMPIVLSKEGVGSTWDREDQILRENPDLIIIHRSAFFHAMNLEMAFGYPDEALFDETRASRLYEYAENKLGAFFGYVARGRPSTSYLVYSRGSPGWLEEESRADWVHQLEGRFPLLRGKIWTMLVPGGDDVGSWRDAETIRMLRENVASILRIDTGQFMR